MSYKRVIPRDLFNEGNLLKCLGQLTLFAENERFLAVEMREGEIWKSHGFGIEQNPGDGSISAAHVIVYIRGKRVEHHRPINSREAWPLYITINDVDYEVFDANGGLSDEFKGLLR